MRKRLSWIAVWILGGVFLVSAGEAAQKPSESLQEHRLWLEDVEPIITRVERDVFLKLKTHQERETFIRFFWRNRDPFPDTAENEFQKEYYERIRYADSSFGIGSHKRGSRTERGTFYRLLGPPLERHRYATHSQVWPLELWFYKGEERYGTPGYFYLIFYQPQGLGDYRLYYPGAEGPEKLVMPSLYGGLTDRAGAYRTIKQINAELAGATLSYLPGETPFGSEAFSSDTIIASIRRLPEKKYSDGYARNYLAFKDIVETEHLDRFVECSRQVKVFREAGQAFLHWSLEPEKMSFGRRGEEIYAAFELVLRVEDGGGRPLFERTEEIPLRLTAEQYRAYERRRFAFQDLLPVIPGRHKALFLLKNKTAKDFTSFEVRFAVPERGRPMFSSPLLYHARSVVPEARRNNMKAFVFDGVEYLVGAGNEFHPGQTLGVFVQAWDFDAEGAGGAAAFAVELISLDTKSSAGVFPLAASPDARPGAETLQVTGEIPLSGIKPGYYRAEVTARTEEGRTVASEEENFVLLSGAVQTAPWVYARLHGPFPGPEHLKVLGGQHYLAGDYAQARDVLERALDLKDDPGVRLLSAKAYLGLGLFRESLERAASLNERLPDREAVKVMAFSFAGLEDWSSALAHLERLMAEATEVPVLNLAAECHLALGRPEAALPLLEKSLAVLPDQPSIKELADKTRKRLTAR